MPCSSLGASIAISRANKYGSGFKKKYKIKPAAKNAPAAKIKIPANSGICKKIAT